MSDGEHQSLGLFNTPSLKWWVSYIGGVDAGPNFVVGGAHEFIFRGDESLTGAVVRLTAVGIEFNIGVKKFGKQRTIGKGRQGGNSGQAEKDELPEVALETLNYKDAVGDHVELRNNPSPWCDMQNVTLLTAKRPFSLLDLSQAWGGIEGKAEVGGYFVGGAVLRLNASLSVISSYSPGDPNTLFQHWPVFNIDGGSVGIGFAWLQGKWSIARWSDLTTNRCAIKSGPGLEKFYSSDPKLQNIP